MSENQENKELNALISLMDEPSDNVYASIREKIWSYGSLAIPLLENAWENSFNPLMQQRTEELIHAIQLEKTKADFAHWASQPSEDLLQAYLIITRYQYPDLSQEDIIKKIGLMSQDVWLELNNDLTALEKIKVLNHIFFDIHKIRGNKANINAPENYYLNHLLESKKGTPLSIGILYIIIARSLNIPIYGVNLPRHFVLAYVDETLRGDKEISESDVFFYINPFNKGAVFTRNEISLYIKQMHLEEKEDYFKPGNTRSIIKRFLEELMASYEAAGSTEKKNEVQEFLDLLL